MTVKDRTDGGYTKREEGGDTVYRAPDGSYCSQQAYAASKAHDDEEDDEVHGGIIEDTNTLVVATLKGRYTNEEADWKTPDQNMKVEVSGVFDGDGPSDNQLYSMVQDAAEAAAEEVRPFDSMGRGDFNVTRTETLEPTEEIDRAEVVSDQDTYGRYDYDYDYRKGRMDW